MQYKPMPSKPGFRSGRLLTALSYLLGYLYEGTTQKPKVSLLRAQGTA